MSGTTSGGRKTPFVAEVVDQVEDVAQALEV
jgi:hypothetical protein